MNTGINHERLDRLSAEIEMVDEKIRDLSRRSRDCDGDERTMQNVAYLLAEAEIKLAWALRSFYVESRVIRTVEVAQEAARRARMGELSEIRTQRREKLG